MGRAFLEPELGVCVITGVGSVIQHRLATRGQLQRQRQTNEPILSVGAHYTLNNRQINTGEEHFSSVSEILNWIEIGSPLQTPNITVDRNDTVAPVTTPAHTPARLTYVPDLPNTSHAIPSSDPSVTAPQITGRTGQHIGKQRVCKAQQKMVQKQRVCKATQQRVLPSREAKESQKQYVFSAATDKGRVSNETRQKKFCPTRTRKCPARSRKCLHTLPSTTTFQYLSGTSTRIRRRVH